jgi:hypothetical protein
MLGRKVSLKILMSQLQKHKVVNIRTTEFSQGRVTRWGIAWSFTNDGLVELVVTFNFMNSTESINSKLNLLQLPKNSSNKLLLSSKLLNLAL